MAKVIEMGYVLRVSRLVKDGTDDTTIFPEELGATIEEMVVELINDPAAIIEVSALNE